MTAGQRGDGSGTRPPHGCRGCPTRWSGWKMAHCSAAGCHRTFTTPQNFDAHRVGPVENRRCDVNVVTDSGVQKLVEYRPGVWGAYDPRSSVLEQPALSGNGIPEPAVSTAGDPDGSELADNVGHEVSDTATVAGADTAPNADEVGDMETEDELPEPTTAQLRRYAADHGFIVGVRGRLPVQVRARWDAEPDEVKQRYLADD